MELDLGVEGLDKGVEIALIESADELADGISSFHDSEGAKTKQVGGCREGDEGIAL
ncbi:MAG: hypothetical protein QOH18_469 [Solirubrobacterales bacterium]|jgi:hypothetical protein|nr:hypothetical protein [Solirubrobacterales bacterium]